LIFDSKALDLLVTSEITKLYSLLSFLEAVIGDIASLLKFALKPLVVAVLVVLLSA
jgi:hypothetical protein